MSRLEERVDGVREEIERLAARTEIMDAKTNALNTTMTMAIERMQGHILVCDSRARHLTKLAYVLLAVLLGTLGFLLAPYFGAPYHTVVPFENPQVRRGILG